MLLCRVSGDCPKLGHPALCRFPPVRDLPDPGKSRAVVVHHVRARLVPVEDDENRLSLVNLAFGEGALSTGRVADLAHIRNAYADRALVVLLVLNDDAAGPGRSLFSSQRDEDQGLARARFDQLCDVLYKHHAR